MKRIMVPLAEGVEEMEATIIVDVLRRAQWDVVTTGLLEGPIQASRGVLLLADSLLADLDAGTFDGLVLPGGLGGTRRLAASGLLLEWVQDFSRQGRLVAAICAAPLVLYQAGILEGRAFTCYPGIEKDMPGLERSEARVEQDGNLITSQGPGTAFAFALAIVTWGAGPEKARELAGQMLLAETGSDLKF